RPRNRSILLLMHGPSATSTRCRSWRSGGSGRPGTMQRGGEFLAELVELAGIDIADRPQIEAGFAPMADVEALHGFVIDATDRGAQRLRDEEIDHVLAAAIDDRRHRLAVDVIERAADQGESLPGQVDDRRRDVELAVEPRLDGVLVAGFDVGQMSGLQRAQMRRHDVAGDLLILVVMDDGNDETCSHGGRQRGAGGEGAEEILAGRAQGPETRLAG